MYLISFFIGFILSAALLGKEGIHLPIGGIIGMVIWFFVDLQLEQKRDEQREKYRIARQNQLKKLEEIEMERRSRLFYELKHGPIIYSPIVEELNKHENLKKAKEYDTWEKEQREFSLKTVKSANSILSNWGCYSYNVEYERINKFGEKYNGKHIFIQFFCASTCLEEDLDYTHFPLRERYAQKVSDIITGDDRGFITSYKNINTFITSLDSPLIYLYNHPQIDDNKLFIHFTELLGTDCEIYTSIDDDYFDEKLCEEDEETYIKRELNRIIVIIDVITKNSHMKDLCTRLFTQYQEYKPLICYISLIKIFDRDEMVSLIEKKKAEIQKKIECQKACIKAVDSWDSLIGGLKYAYLLNYYPTNCDFELTQSEWDDRWTIWHFKNTPNKVTEKQNQAALSYIIPLLKTKLINTFGEENLKYLTLVCIPASTQVKTQRRYEEFSHELCKETGLINAYNKITVVQDRLAKHEGGSKILTDNLSYKEDFFKDKFILLFDDVITSGNSMYKFKNKMESLGATVVAGISIGKTFHHRVN